MSWPDMWSVSEGLVLQAWVSDGEGIFFLEDEWIRLMRLHAALRDSQTWAEFSAALPPGEFEELYQWESNGGESAYRVDGELRFLGPLDPEDPPIAEESIIDANSPFSTDDIWDYGDGDFPPWIQCIFDGLPQEFVSEFARPVDSFISGSWHQYPMAKADEMVAALRSHGYGVSVVGRLPR